MRLKFDKIAKIPSEIELHLEITAHWCEFADSHNNSNDRQMSCQFFENNTL